MNRNHLRAWLLAFAGLGLTVSAHAQIPADQNWIWICDDPSTTTDTKFSTDYNALRHMNDLFGVAVGTSGTASFETCFGNPGFTADVAGRIGFQIGPEGSKQDEYIEGKQIDNNLMLTPGMPWGTGGNWGYAKVVRQTTAGARTMTAWGNGGVDGYFIGASDRYMQLTDTVDSMTVTLRVDLVGDAAKLTWNMVNNGEATDSIGLWFGQYVVGLGSSSNVWVHGMKNVRVPGMRPIITAKRFATDVNAIVRDIPNNPMPSKIDFGLTQALNYGLQVILQPTAGTTSAYADQTQPTYFDVGGAGWHQSPSLLGSVGANDQPMGDDYSQAFFNGDFQFVYPDDDNFIDDVGYIEKWEPIAQTSRTIVAYYKSTTGVSDYAKPYAAVVDGPQVVGLSDSTAFGFKPSSLTLRVYIDNVRGYTDAGTGVPLKNVRITIELPTGLYDADSVSNPTGDTTKTKVVKYIDTVLPNNPATVDPSTALSYIDFPVKVTPDTNGVLTYKVTIEPQPGSTKVLYPTINIATQPRLLVREKANLVTAPWSFKSGNWDQILGAAQDVNTVKPSGLKSDTDYQVFYWDPQRQEYRVQTAPTRGYASWIVAASNFGVRKLGGTPSVPSDLKAGADTILLRPGWNLVGNPYPFPIELGQILGVPVDNQTATVSFAKMVENQTISGALAYWDQNTQSYKYISSTTDLMLPNRGYWIRVLSSQSVYLRYPPVFQSFVPSGTGGITNSSGWMLNLVARTSKAVDDQNFIGTAATDAQARTARVYEAPLAPISGAISASVADGNNRYAVSLKPKTSTLSWNYAVETRDSGVVTLTWPNISTLPSSVSLKLVDATTGASVDMRKTNALTFNARANSVKNYRIEAVSSDAASNISNLSATANRSYAVVSYKLGTTAKTTLRVLQGTKQIAVLTANRQEAAGSKAITWNLRDSANRLVTSGVYTFELTSVNGTSTETKTTSVLISR